MNVEIVRKALTDLESLPDLLADDLIWHFYGNVEGIAVDHHGRDDVFANLWGKLFEVGEGTFSVVSVSIDAVAVYRVRAGVITEAFDIPSTPKSN